MKLRLLGSNSTGGQSPTLYETDRGTYVIQGWKVADTEALSAMNIPNHETAIEVPKALLDFAQRSTG